jgi:ribosome-binding factor A
MRKRGRGSGSAPPGPSQRQLRVGEELRHILASILMRGEFRDPDLQGVNVTVSEVRVSPDLRNATAFVMPLGGAQEKPVVAALNRAAVYIRGQIARSVDLRLVPQVDFRVDESYDEAAKIARLLRRPDVAVDLPDPDQDGEPPDHGKAS